MVRLIVYAIFAFILWRVIRVFTGTPRWKAPPQQPKTPTPKDLGKIQDAEFEDITPRKESEEKQPPPSR